MIDPKLLRSDPESVARNLARRGFTLDVEVLRTLEERRKASQIEADRLRAERNANAKAVGMAKGRGEDAAPLLKGQAVIPPSGYGHDKLQRLPIGQPNRLQGCQIVQTQQPAIRDEH